MNGISFRRQIMAAYSREDFEQIAAAMRKDVTQVCRYEKRLEAAAMWYRLDQNALKIKRVTPFVMRRRMTQIANAARKLLRHLGVWDPAEAPDGPARAVLQVLASTDDGTEDAVVRATARIGRLIEILEAANAVGEFERRANIGAEDVWRIGKLTLSNGHQGEAAVNDWIASICRSTSKSLGPIRAFPLWRPAGLAGAKPLGRSFVFWKRQANQ